MTFDSTIPNLKHYDDYYDSSIQDAAQTIRNTLTFFYIKESNTIIWIQSLVRKYDTFLHRVKVVTCNDS